MSTLREYVPTEGWLGAWCKEMSDVIATPGEFVLASGIAALSATVGRQLYFPLGRRRWYPHVWMMLLGQAGVRKSIAVNAALQAVRTARGEEGLLPTRWSPEGFYEALKENPDGFWDVGEISGFLKGAGKDYMAGARQELCDVWDSKFIYRRLKKKADSTSVDNPAPTAMATGRISDFMDAAGMEDFESGFFSRWLVVSTESTGEEFYRGMLESHEENSSDARAQDLYQMRTVLSQNVRKAVFTTEAMLLWEEQDRKWMFDGQSDDLSGFALRRGIQAAKLAVLYALGTKFDPHVTVEPADVAWGLGVVEICFDSVRAMHMTELGMSSRAQERSKRWKKVLELARRSGGAVKVRDIYTYLVHDFPKPQDARSQIDMWELAGMVEKGALKPERGPAAEAVRIVNGHPPPENWVETTRRQPAEKPAETSAGFGREAL